MRPDRSPPQDHRDDRQQQPNVSQPNMNFFELRNSRLPGFESLHVLYGWNHESKCSRKTGREEMREESAVAHLANAWRVASSVLMSDSFGSFWTTGSIIHPMPYGTSRVSDIARHSTYTSLSRSSNRQ